MAQVRPLKVRLRDTKRRRPGSTRWLTITDVDPTATGNVNRVYSNSILAPNDITVGEYTFTVRMDVQSIGSVNSLVVAQHFDSSGTPGYKNLGGLQITPTGVNAIIAEPDW